MPIFLPGIISTESSVTWNPSDKGANISLSNGNLDASTTVSSVWHAVRATVGRSGGRRYFELVITAVTFTYAIIGIANGSASVTTYPGDSASGAGHQVNGADWVNGVTLANDPTTAMVVNDVIGFAVDFALGYAWIAVNGTWLASGNPAGGATPWISGISGTWYPCASVYAPSNTVRLRTKYAEFTQTVPGGFVSWAAN